MFLNLERNSNARVKVDITDDKGQVIIRKLVNIYSDKDLQWLIQLNPKWSIPELNTLLGQLCDTQPDENKIQPMLAYDDYEPPSDLIKSIKQIETTGDRESAVEEFTINIREINQTKKSSIKYSDINPQQVLRDVLENPPEHLVEPLLEWNDRDKLCCLDIDYHNVQLDKRPTNEHLYSIISQIKPQPFCWHPSHGKGAKLYYIATPGYTATELAAVAGLNYVEHEPCSTFDLAKTSRHPLYKRTRDNVEAPCKVSTDIHYCYGSGDVSSLRRIIMSEVSQEDINEYLNERGWSIGQTLPHSYCPIDPGNSSDETKENVYVGDTGLYCHRCSGRGYSISNNPGFTSYTNLIGKKTDNRLRLMIRNFCHLEHALIVLENIYKNIPLETLKIIYKVLLKIVHTGDDPRIKMAMTAGKGFIRTNSQWVSTDGINVITKGLEQFVRSLPAVLIPTDDGFSINVPTYIAFMNQCKLDEYGYPEISLLRGCKVYGQHLPYPHDEIVKVIVRKEFKNVPPTYLIKSKRMDSETAWGILESEFPGIERNYVKLLIAAKGASEGRLAQCPFLLITGPSGAGKSTTVKIVAGICGDKSSEPVWVPQIDRFRQALMDASRESGYVVIDEVFKYADRSRLTATQALDPMLSLTEDSRSHVMYIGSVSFGRLPVFVLTDIDVPREVESDIQLSRRFTFYRLQQKNEWSDTFVHKRIQPHEFRLLSSDHNLAADTILSEVIDTYFQTPISLSEIAKSLDITTLETYAEDIDRTKDLLKRFYDALKAAPKLSGSDADRYTPEWGWKRIDRISNNPLNELWNDLCDGQTPESWIKSRSIQSADWGKIIGTKFPIQCEIRSYRNSILYVRFRSTDSPKKPCWVNGELI